MIRKQLLRWYRRHGRSLPWRHTRDPYRIWISEVMLQQTQVTTVIPYYGEFLRAFPTVEVLARAPLRKVLKQWEGLGYYSRARHLHKAAQIIFKEWKGKFPADPGTLEKLPGIGRSTAGAICSLAFGRRQPILDGNLKRLFTRLLGIEEAAHMPAVQRRLWAFSEQILPRTKVADHNQALMDLGATVCTPRSPSCASCPLARYCTALRNGIQDRIPNTRRAKAVSHRHMISAIIFLNGRFLVLHRPEKGLLGGLWGVPEIPCTAAPKPGQGLRKPVWSSCGIRARYRRALRPVDHAFTHLKMTYYPIILDYIGGKLPAHKDGRWITRSEIKDFPFPAATHRIFAQLPESTEYSPASDATAAVAAETEDTVLDSGALTPRRTRSD